MKILNPLLALLLSTACMDCFAAITSVIQTGTGPVIDSSPNSAAYINNMIVGMETHTNMVGSPATPAYFLVQNSIDPRKAIDTSGLFPSWNGTANPSSPFDQEYGGELHWVLHVISSTKIKLGEIKYFNTGLFGSTISGSFQEFTYGYTGIGVGRDYGADGIRSSDDIIYATGNLYTDVNELVVLGLRESYVPNGGPSPQSQLDQLITNMVNFTPYTETTRFEIWSGAVLLDTVEKSVSMALVPEPSPLALMVLAGIGTLGLRSIIRKR